MMRVRVRGIYATALTRLLLDGEYEVVDASGPIRERFDADFGDGAADASIHTTRDRQGVGISGDPEAVADLRELLAGVGLDALSWADPAPAGAVFDGVVDEARGGGATVDLPGGAAGYLPFDAVDGYVDVGDRFRVQVREPAPLWDDDDPRLGTGIEADAGLVTLQRGRDGVSVVAGGADATELARTTELLSAEAPENWRVRWERAALDAGMDAKDAALEAAAAEAEDLDDALADAPDDPDEPRAIATPGSTAWVWFGREARFSLDERRRQVTATMPGHHRVKAADEAASTAVDFAEAVCDPGGEFPFGAVADAFGPTKGDRVAIEHGKPDGRSFSLGRGEVTEFDPDGKITVEREMRSEGTYDALGTERQPGDRAVTKLEEGRWWYPTAYRGEDGERKGTYVNVCTPVELYPGAARYVDLHVDVVKTPDGEVRRVDEDELDAAVEAGHVSEDLAEKARSVAAAVERALS